MSLCSQSSCSMAHARTRTRRKDSESVTVYCIDSTSGEMLILQLCPYCSCPKPKKLLVSMSPKGVQGNSVFRVDYETVKDSGEPLHLCGCLPCFQHIVSYPSLIIGLISAHAGTGLVVFAFYNFCSIIQESFARLQETIKRVKDTKN